MCSYPPHTTQYRCPLLPIHDMYTCIQGLWNSLPTVFTTSSPLTGRIILSYDSDLLNPGFEPSLMRGSRLAGSSLCSRSYTLTFVASSCRSNATNIRTASSGGNPGCVTSKIMTPRTAPYLTVHSVPTSSSRFVSTSPGATCHSRFSSHELLAQSDITIVMMILSPIQDVLLLWWREQTLRLKDTKFMYDEGGLDIGVGSLNLLEPDCSAGTCRFQHMASHSMLYLIHHSLKNESNIPNEPHYPQILESLHLHLRIDLRLHI